MSNTHKNKKITIIGAGWLGTPLTYALLQSGYDVIATKQSAEGCETLQTQLLNTTSQTQLLKVAAFSDEHLKNNRLTQASLKALFHERQVIITIPPTPFIRRYAKTQEMQGIHDYATFIQQIIMLASTYDAKELIYTSSTSVYGDSSGIIHEALPAMPKTISAKAIRLAEKALEADINIPVTILRLAGLIGNGRHPIYHLSDRDNIPAPFDAINLLHIQDLIPAITAILMRDKALEAFEIYNLVTPFHPNRQSYYQAMASALSLPLPNFEAPKPLLKKIIDGGKITQAGDFNYQEMLLTP